MIVNPLSINKVKVFLFVALLFLFPTQLGYHFWPEWSLVFGVRVDYLSPTIYLTDILVVSLLVCWLLEKLFNKKLAFKINNISFLLLITVSYILITSYSSLSPQVAFLKLLKISELILFGSFVYHHKSLFEKYKNFFAFGLLLAIVIGIGQFITQSSLGGLFWYFGERSFNISSPGVAKEVLGGVEILRPYSTFSHPNSLAGFVLVALLITGWWKKTYAKFVFALGGILLLLSFSQSSWFTALFLLAMYLLKPNTKQFILFTFMAALFLSVSPCLLSKFLPSEDIILRKKLLEAAVSIFSSYPFSGVGLNNFLLHLAKFNLNSGVWFLQPVHNIFILSLVELGIGGVSLLLLVVKKMNLRFSNIAFPIVAIVLTGSLDHYWLTLQQNQLLLALVLGLGIQLRKYQHSG